MISHKPIIMVAPNGARKTKKDHHQLPVSIQQTVEEAAECFEAGARMLHGHVRGQQEEHVLDPELYMMLMSEMRRQVPDMLLQITTEAVGVYTPQQQVDCVKACSPEFISVGLREMTSMFTETDIAKGFYHWCDQHQTHVQHIVFDASDFNYFLRYRREGIIPASHRCVLFVLGRYTVDFQSSPDDLIPFFKEDLNGLDFFTCAFGSREQDCVFETIMKGGHARIGFENNMMLPGGQTAAGTSHLVLSLVERLEADNISPATPAQAREILRCLPI